ncbi:S8 family serine peptidase [Haliscomenobacter hydrossis]|uniref:Aqualysin 1 n=1 Tax=Haliscomenobacter hydrossis (strain ATCC 27775 / DSM 1100 / LMG 10767 / O) TaxID=760192 RepID=F4L589_HALH1|nr:S8 family serine peptidase [Haliscomenobacter hydrossis]AEE49769.1 Aqualysin 1 [Haliscomenobacter hydrossis DSM 1100]
MNGVKWAAWAILCVMFACTTAEEDTLSVPAEPEDCLVKASANSGAILVGEYIVVMKAGSLRSSSNAVAMQEQAETLLQRYGVETEESIENTFHGAAVSGFVAQLNDETVQRLRNDPAVAFVEPDRILGLCACVQLVNTRQVSWNVRKTGYGNGLNFSQKTVWIIDSGVDLNHPDLNIDLIRSQSFVSGETSAEDINGHGTHVAGIIGAVNNNLGILGIASGASLVALKVLDKEGEGRTSDILRAVAYASQNGQAGDVVNMSLGGEGTSLALEREIRAAADKGILFAIAAGNEGKAAVDYSPARVNHANVFTVSAVDSTDTFASFSNFGNDVVDVAAYGVRITSTWLNGRYAIASGTSAATPHVAALLLIRGRNFPTRGVAKQDPDGVPDPIARE